MNSGCPIAVIIADIVYRDLVKNTREQQTGMKEVKRNWGRGKAFTVFREQASYGSQMSKRVLGATG